MSSFRGTRALRAATLPRLCEHSRKIYHANLTFRGKRFTLVGLIGLAKWPVFRGKLIGIGVALCDGRRSGAAKRAIGRELRPEVLPPPFLHFKARPPPVMSAASLK